ncbi:MAG: scavenger receptor cysteine-rich domain-containing protein [Methylococcales symbiont of Iophon sp. n. MRB-2018]|nr:MAG: scavenger receptor cysteine-rich domain-containing protein [Methylococcales symbiont of Iophon sp. n. MRB-2018]
MDDCEDGDVQLTGVDSTLGLVEVCINKAWGTMCNRRFGTNEATVICHQLGFTTGELITYSLR